MILEKSLVIIYYQNLLLKCFDSNHSLFYIIEFTEVRIFTSKGNCGGRFSRNQG